MAAYIPPHKRHSKYGEKAVPTPSSLLPLFRRNLNLRPSSDLMRRREQHASQGGKICYARNSISKWWAIGLTDDHCFPPSVRLEPVSCELFEQRNRGKPLALMNNRPSGETSKETQSSTDKPWVSITEKLHIELYTSFQSVSNEMESIESEVKPSFVARFGKLFFRGDPSMNQDMILQSSTADNISKNQVIRSFFTNVPDAYIEAIQLVVVPKIGFDFESEKEHYHVKVYDKFRPDVNISCKCFVINDGAGLGFRKAELNPLRHLVADMSCLDKDIDLRLMLATKRILVTLTAEEDRGIRELLKHAVLYPDVKGGLRWPPGKETFGDRFSVVGVWHTKYKTYKGSTMRLKLRHADRFDFQTSTGEAAKEVTLKMDGISRLVRGGTAEINVVKKMLQDNLELIWDHFLGCRCSFS